MKETYKFFCLFLGVAAVLAACGADEDNPCVQAKSIFEAGQSAFCEGQDEDCEYCACRNQGLFLDVANGNCIAPPEEESKECEGMDELAGLACLADKAACEQDSADIAKFTCQSEYLQKICTLDSDCKYDMICPPEIGMCSLP